MSVAATIANQWEQLAQFKQTSEGIWLTMPVPESVNRVWRNFGGHTVKSVAARAHATGAAREFGPWLSPMAGPLVIAITWYRARRAGDWDAKLKQVCDILEGICYQNDSQICEGHVFRVDTDPKHPRIEVTVRKVV